MAGQMVTLTLMTTADNGVPADLATGGEGAEELARNAAKASLRIVFRIASLHRGDRSPHSYSTFMPCSPRIRHKGATIGRTDVLDARGGAWNENKSSSWAAARSAWRSPFSWVCGASAARWWKAGPS